MRLTFIYLYRVAFEPCFDIEPNFSAPHVYKLLSSTFYLGPLIMVAFGTKITEIRRLFTSSLPCESCFDFELNLLSLRSSLSLSPARLEYWQR